MPSDARPAPASASDRTAPLAIVVGWMGGATFAFTMMAVAGREAGLTLDTFEIMLFRSLTGVAIVVSVAWHLGTLDQIRTKRLGLHLVRNAAHFTGQNLWFFAVGAIPLAQVFALEFTTPLWAMLLAPLLIGERLTRRMLAAAAIGFVGILIAAHPDFTDLNPGVVAAFSCAIFFALTGIMTRSLTCTESITCILFWLTVIQACLGLGFSALDGEITLPQGTAIFWVILIGCMGLLAHFCLTQALKIAPTSTVMPLDYARLPVIVVVGMVFYDQPFDILIFVGAGFIFFANWLNLSRPRGPKEASALGVSRET